MKNIERTKVERLPRQVLAKPGSRLQINTPLKEDSAVTFHSSEVTIENLKAEESVNINDDSEKRIRALLTGQESGVDYN